MSFRFKLLIFYSGARELPKAVYSGDRELPKAACHVNEIS